MSKVKALEHSIEAIGGQLPAVQMLLEAMIVEGIRTKSIDEKEFMILLDQGMDAFHNNRNMTDQETFEGVHNSVSQGYPRYPARRLTSPQNRSRVETMSNSSFGLAWSIFSKRSGCPYTAI